MKIETVKVVLDRPFNNLLEMATERGVYVNPQIIPWMVDAVEKNVPLAFGEVNLSLLYIEMSSDSAVCRQMAKEQRGWRDGFAGAIRPEHIFALLLQHSELVKQRPGLSFVDLDTRLICPEPCIEVIRCQENGRICVRCKVYCSVEHREACSEVYCFAGGIGVGGEKKWDPRLVVSDRRADCDLYGECVLVGLTPPLPTTSAS